jgi:hypothetical protein
MSASLVLLFLIGMAAIVWSACFIGCDTIFGLHTTTTITPYYQYQTSVTTTPGLVAFWPLNDTSGTVAVDLGPNHFDGTYTVGPTGTFMLDQPNIVVGDTIGNNPSDPNPCVYFNGGYVNIPGEAAFGAANFTIEAWVRPYWTSSDVTTKVVVACASAAPSPNRGFALYATPNTAETALVWAAGLGQGGTKEAIAIFGDTSGSNQTIAPGMLYFLVVTYDGTNLTLWVNPADDKQKITNNSASGYVPVSQLPQQIPFFIAMGRPDLPPPNDPFNGWIQDVAFYNVVLSVDIIETHYMNGNGMG